MSNDKMAPLIVVSGASGSGKTTLCREISNKLGLYYGVSHTTREKREGERDGVDYYFIDKARFEKMVKGHEFLEWALVYDNLYGTSKDMVFSRLKTNQGVILDVDTVGAANIKKAYPASRLIFIDVPSLGELKKRLEKRGTDSPAVCELRLKKALEEEKCKNQYDHIIFNDDLNKAYGKLKEIILAET
ncbi:MAG: guanylate kinase [Deltaproteobacteria bacterium RIFCSPLOWO2_12_FULL_40_28]|nr:MAG: guanylate kinase [Deltaproteobacteria bacterium RIFCSPHIGHO2_02_FULL_40_28]OGQ20788.1 MAG: guanylate kinase [Deltaproteobacteria bacterium RIFCSPHIGHO2_12_FULL_40_32]OGQ39189.1 MAG: guanylate kinase [Deltaproteobacteria bacterium RIFCSPLOWO2_02_FULL_40_36]OGQ54469.1 MAG: guanylate kinase [Deltaproteobacteria bacterium RIFCSPLOWO2_12_FULL_40_28]